MTTLAARNRGVWPQVPAAHELRATIEEVGAAAISSRAKLAAARERMHRLQRSGVHVHMCGGLAVRMVPLVATDTSKQRSPDNDPVASPPDDLDELPF